MKLQCSSGSYLAVYQQLLQVTVLNISGSFVWSSGSGVVTPFSMHFVLYTCAMLVFNVFPNK